jgi:proteic killer suppression protein
MILSYGDRATEDLHRRDKGPSPFPPHVRKTAARKLDLLAAAVQLSDLWLVPGNRLEALRGDLAGYHSIRVNRQWRIVFRWTSDGPSQVRMTDYHS